MKGIVLEPGMVVVLALDGTLVYVEEVKPTYAAVVALPEQPLERADDRVFTPGCVGAKKISPFSQPDKQVGIGDLTVRNKEFIGTYEQLRALHGPHFVERTDQEIAAMSVRKETGGRGARALKRAAKKQSRLHQRCETCGEQPGHPNHPGKHDFVPPTEQPDSSAQEETARVPRTPRQPRAASASSAAARYTLVSDDLSAAQAQPRGDKFNPGNRSHRVVLALASLPNKSGTIEDVIAALCTDGKTPPANPQKIVRRTLNQLRKVEFGACVSTDAAPDTDDADGE